MMTAEEWIGNLTTGHSANGTMAIPLPLPQVIYTPPEGKRIKRILSPTEIASSWEFVDNDHGVDYRFLDSSGLVDRFEVVGDTDGDESGTRTSVRVLYNPILVELVDSEPGSPGSTGTTDSGWRQLVVEDLFCNETEDWWGADEARLEIFGDGSLLTPTLKRDMDDGDLWNINKSFVFYDQVEVKLWDADVSVTEEILTGYQPDADDLLGKITLGKGTLGHGEASFTLDGADYRLRYRVTKASAPKIQTAQDALQAFERSKGSGVWAAVDKDQLVREIADIIENPIRIYQAQTPLCGPASIAYELASREPRRYVEVVQQLYETGKFDMRTKEVEASESLTNGPIPSGMRAADWMLLSTMRDAENWLFPMDPADPWEVEGMTFPGEMQGWSYELLGYDNVEYESTYVFGEFDALRKAQEVRNAGGVAFLMIHSALLKETEEPEPWPTHWVSFLGNLTIDEGNWLDSGRVTFDVFSWGNTKSVDKTADFFEECMWGVVTGRD